MSAFTNFSGQPIRHLCYGNGFFARQFFPRLLNEAGDAGSIVLFQREHDWRVEAFEQQRGRYHVLLRGLQGGDFCERVERINSVAAMLDLQRSWALHQQIWELPSLERVLSNTSEHGFHLADCECENAPAWPTKADPVGLFPRLLCGLRHRWECGLPGVLICPAELRVGNAGYAKRKLRELAHHWSQRSPSHWGCAEKLLEWIESECAFSATLVDQLTPGRPEEHEEYGDPLMVLAEQYARYVVEKQPGFSPFADHPQVFHLPSAVPDQLMKIFILNCSHTAGASWALQHGYDPDRTLFSDLMAVPQARSFLEELIYSEIIPALPPSIPTETFTQELLEERYPNKAVASSIRKVMGGSNWELIHRRKVKDRVRVVHAVHLHRKGSQPRLLSQILEWEKVLPKPSIVEKLPLEV